MVAFPLLMIPWNVLLWLDRPPRPARKKAARETTPARPTRVRLVRFAVGGLTALGRVALRRRHGVSHAGRQSAGWRVRRRAFLLGALSPWAA